VRLFVWTSRVLAAAAWGAAIRFARRLARRPPRIWHGPNPLHSIRYMVAADRLAGYPSRSVVLTEKQVKYDLVTRGDFDVVVRSETTPWQDLHWLALIDLLLRGDVWVAFFDGLFFNVADRRKNELAFRLLRAAGIRIVVTAHGSDIIRLDVPPTRYDWIARMQKDYPTWDFAAQTPVSKTRIDHFCRHSDLVLPGDSIMARLIPRNDLLIKVYPIDTDELRPVDPPPHESVKIIHAPNHRYVKGTDFLMAAIDRLTAKGFRCELVLIEGVARSEALRRFAEADIIADQFCMGGWAQFALEGMALGKPVLTYLDREHLESPQFNLPVVNTTPENLPEVLAVLIELEELRRRLGTASRTAVERYQSIPAMGEVWDRIYRHVWWRKPLDFTGTAHFSPERTRRSLTEDPAQEEFWPVEVGEWMGRIRAAIARVR
jgi:glycosyltransferase involved in cell wall biosynthesis